jgi:ion channel-forming bestrophin family protein
VPLLVTEFFRSGRTLWYVLSLALLTGLYSCLPLLITQSFHMGEGAPELHAALSLIVGWLLVFRTNTAHARWWEARTLWGQLVNVSRNLALKISHLGSIPEADMRRARQLLIDFPQALKFHLRDELTDPHPGNVLLTGNEFLGNGSHVPLAIANEFYELMGKWKKNGSIDGDELRVLDAEAARLLDVCGGCERIQRTRIIRSYRVFARQCVVLFLLTLPWGIAKNFGWWTVPLTTLSAYFMFGIEIVAEHVEEPFGYDDDDLDLDSLCHTISMSVSEVFNSTNDS